jgi:sugar lactone lactonase YvrE
MEAKHQRQLNAKQPGRFQRVRRNTVRTTCFALAVLVATGAGCGGSSSTPGQPGNPDIQLWVADTKNNRVLGYHAPLQNGDPAAVVLGQTTFGPTACNSGGLGKTTLCGPLGVTIDAAGNAWVADAANNRVLRFAPPFANGQDATLVIGQFTFVTSGPCVADRRSLCGPRGLVFDQQGNLWVADSNNNRVLEFTAPFSTGMPASMVLGQPNFTNTACGQVSNLGMCSPGGLAFDTKGDLFASDGRNSRVIMFNPPFRMAMAASLAVGQLSLVSNTRFLTTQFSLSSPSGIAVDNSDNLYVADTDNSRIMIFPPPTGNGQNASAVLGADNFTSINLNACGPGSNGSGPSINGGTICHPLDVKVDEVSTVVVADQNDRTLIFKAPVTTGALATTVLGQLNLTLQVPPTGLATSQNDPGGLGVSAALLGP